ncbi:metallopeptidase family protein [Falsirhodobacter sp. alg1]|uniref:metallopeptidase family protein n=1 Tax=Falsirhodobacter sp. alg1 TaxID=1472418 RepID=UPI000AA0088C|nr:metallopeptidase family protein [Falsirhodobacter sp. alg1]
MDHIAPDLATLEKLAYQTVADLPQPWQGAAATIVLIVEDFPDEALMAEMDIHDSFALTGLYEGIPLTQKSVMDQPMGPDVIRLFRRPILDEWCDRGNVTLRELVSHIMVHELAHHFGWSDDDIAAIDPWWE